MGISSGEFDILHQTQAIRGQLMDGLGDADLTYRLAGDNPPLGALCREMGQVEQSYIDSFRTLKQSFAYPAVDVALETSVEKLKAWYAALDAELESALIALKDESVQAMIIDRGFPMPVGAQFHTYREALLIFYAKASCYLKAMGKSLSPQMRGWIG